MYETESDTELGFLPGVEREIHNTRGRPSKAGKRKTRTYSRGNTEQQMGRWT